MQVFERVFEPSLESVANGGTASLFCYGYTGNIYGHIQATQAIYMDIYRLYRQYIHTGYRLYRLYRQKYTYRLKVIQAIYSTWMEMFIKHYLKIY